MLYFLDPEEALRLLNGVPRIAGAANMRPSPLAAIERARPVYTAALLDEHGVFEVKVFSTMQKAADWAGQQECLQYQLHDLVIDEPEYRRRGKLLV